ncbi:MAG: VIT1/CCC1 transporter family protein [Candidatus Nanohaloarchaea archaeon]|nr:VIT1/CCC1 transporter family protein [Candidatus Nanohaloarchaea archaeon]
MLQSIREAFGREEVRSISRRYFISNGFDGTLTAIGVTVGSFLSGVDAGMTVVKIGVGATVGLATSGVWSVWEIERAEKLADLHDLEASMLEDLSETELRARKKAGRVVNSLMSGLGPTIAMLLIISPFLFEGAVLTMRDATIASVAVGVATLFTFGAYMGSISRQKWWKAGARMGLAGLVVALINVLLPG